MAQTLGKSASTLRLAILADISVKQWWRQTLNSGMEGLVVRLVCSLFIKPTSKVVCDIDFLGFVLTCHLMFRPLTFFFYNQNNGHHKSLMLKQFHLLGRGDVLADAVKSERSQEKHWGHTDQGELLPLTCLSSSLRVTEVWTDNDCRGVAYCRNTRACFWAVKWKDKRRKQGPGIWDDTTESHISQGVPWNPHPTAEIQIPCCNTLGV